MFKRHLIRLLKKSAITNAKFLPLSNRSHLLCSSNISSLNCCASFSQFNISICERTFSSDSKAETEIQRKDTKLPDAEDIPHEENIQKCMTSEEETPISSKCETPASSAHEIPSAKYETPASFKDENASIDWETEGQNEFRSAVVYMRGLPYSATKEEIIQFFVPLGIKPTKVVLRTDRFGYSNGKAEVEFETSDDATKALKKQNHYIGNRYIELSLEPYPQMNADRAMFRRETDDVRDPLFSGPGDYTVKLGGLPYEATAEDVCKFFENLNIKPVEINLKYSAGGQPLGLCFVKFKTREEAMEALKNNNEYIGSRYIRVTMMRSSQGRMQYSGGFHDDQRGFGRYNDGIKSFEG